VTTVAAVALKSRDTPSLHENDLSVCATYAAARASCITKSRRAAWLTTGHNLERKASVDDKFTLGVNV
jgi:hypothetical protein